MHLYCATYFTHRLLSLELGTPGTFLHYRDDLFGMFSKLSAALPNRPVAFDYGVGQSTLAIYAADASAAAVVIEAICGLTRQKEPVHLTDIAVFGVTRIGSLDPCSVGYHHPGFLTDDL